MPFSQPPSSQGDCHVIAKKWHINEAPLQGSFLPMSPHKTIRWLEEGHGCGHLARLIRKEAEREREDLVHSSWPGKKEAVLLSLRSELVFIGRVLAFLHINCGSCIALNFNPLKLGRAAYTVKSP